MSHGAALPRDVSIYVASIAGWKHEGHKIARRILFMCPSRESVPRQGHAFRSRRGLDVSAFAAGMHIHESEGCPLAGIAGLDSYDVLVIFRADLEFSDRP